MTKRPRAVTWLPAAALVATLLATAAVMDDTGSAPTRTDLPSPSAALGDLASATDTWRHPTAASVRPRPFAGPGSGSIDVVVRDESTLDPIEGATVVASFSNPPSAPPIALTDGAGRARLDVERVDDCVRLVVRHHRYADAERNLSLDCGQNRVVVGLKGSTSVAGRVVDAAGAPAGGARIALVTSDRMYPTTADAQGAFRYEGVRSFDSAFVEATRDGIVRVRERVTPGETDLLIRIQATRVLAVTVSVPALASFEHTTLTDVDIQADSVSVGRGPVDLRFGMGMLEVQDPETRTITGAVRMNGAAVIRANATPTDADEGRVAFLEFGAIEALRARLVTGAQSISHGIVQASIGAELVKARTDGDGLVTVVLGRRPDPTDPVRFFGFQGVSRPFQVGALASAAPRAIELGDFGGRVRVTSADPSRLESRRLALLETRYGAVAAANRIDGNAREYWLPPGTYTLVVDGLGVSRRLVVRDGETAQISLDDVGAGSVCGVAGASGVVAVIPTADAWSTMHRERRVEPRTAFRFDALTPGEYVVAARFDDGSLWSRKVNVETDAVVDLGRVGGDAGPALEITIRGHGGAPLASCDVVVSVVPAVAFHEAVVRTDPSGTLRVRRCGGQGLRLRCGSTALFVPGSELPTRGDWQLPESSAQQRVQLDGPLLEHELVLAAYDLDCGVMLAPVLRTGDSLLLGCHPVMPVLVCVGGPTLDVREVRSGPSGLRAVPARDTHDLAPEGVTATAQCRLLVDRIGRWPVRSLDLASRWLMPAARTIQATWPAAVRCVLQTSP